MRGLSPVGALFLATGALAQLTACESRRAAPDFSDGATDSGGSGASAGTTGSGGAEPWTVPWEKHACQPGTLPTGKWTPTNWKTHTDDPACTHVDVEAHCDEGWCQIPAGCFVSGPREDEYGAPVRSVRATIRLTHGFVMQQSEFSLAAWKSLGFSAPVPFPKSQRPCERDDCPVTQINWFAALQAANALSREHELPECYALTGCEGTPDSSAFTCSTVALTAASAYACTGYRLPTRAEREYAARAGTQTTFYSGEITNNGASPRDTYCYDDPALQKAAWYCFNTEHVQPAKCREPNRWGLYDMLGNVAEWTSLDSAPRAGPVTDPDAVWPEAKPELATFMNGSVGLWPAATSAYAAAKTAPTGASGFEGFRLVRTLL